MSCQQVLTESEVVARTSKEEHHDKKEGVDSMEEEEVEEEDGARERATNPESSESYFSSGNFSRELALPEVSCHMIHCITRTYFTMVSSL